MVRSRVGLVERIDRHDVAITGDRPRDVPPRADEARLDPHTARPRIVAPERRERRVEVRAEGRPRRRAVEAAGPPPPVLVEVDHRPDPVAAEQPVQPRHAGDVRIVVVPGARLDPLPDEPDPRHREALAGEQARIGPPELPADERRVLRTTLNPWRTTTRPWASTSQRPSRWTGPRATALGCRGGGRSDCQRECEHCDHPRALTRSSHSPGGKSVEVASSVCASKLVSRLRRVVQRAFQRLCAENNAQRCRLHIDALNDPRRECGPGHREPDRFWDPTSARSYVPAFRRRSA